MDHTRRKKNEILAFRPNKSWANARRVARVKPTFGSSQIMADRSMSADALLEIRKELGQKK